MSNLHEYAFDVEVVTVIRVKAASVDEARQKIRGHLDCATANFGAWEDSGEPIVSEVSVNHTENENDAIHLFEIDGKEVD